MSFYNLFGYATSCQFVAYFTVTQEF